MVLMERGTLLAMSQIKNYLTQWRVARGAHVVIALGLLGLIHGTVTGASALSWPSPYMWTMLAGLAFAGHSYAVYNMDLAARTAALFLSLTAVVMRGIGFLFFPTAGGGFNAAAAGAYFMCAAAMVLLWNQRRHGGGTLARR